MDQADLNAEIEKLRAALEEMKAKYATERERIVTSVETEKNRIATSIDAREGMVDGWIINAAKWLSDKPWTARAVVVISLVGVYYVAIKLFAFGAKLF